MSEYLVYCSNYNANFVCIKEQITHCISGSALYEELYELQVHPTELLDFNETTMFQLEQSVQSELSLYLKSDKWDEIKVSWFPGEVQTIPYISIADTDYPDNYNGYTPISIE